MRLPIVALALGLLAGCQPLPHPFADQASSPSLPPLRPRDSAGITVLPVAAAGAPEEHPLADALVHALIGHDMLASTDATNRGSFRLSTSVTAAPTSAGRLHVTLNWRLADPKGAKLGEGIVEDDATEASWDAGDPSLAASLADDAASKIVGLLAGDGPQSPTGSADALVALRGISGAPGDGNKSLAAAIVRALARAGIAVASGTDTPPLALTCVVEVTPAQAGKQQVQIHWQLSKRDGGSLGHADQQNIIPAGSLDGAWADIAFAVAAAAAPGIADLVHKAEPMVSDAGTTLAAVEHPELAIPPQRVARPAPVAAPPVVPDAVPPATPPVAVIAAPPAEPTPAAPPPPGPPPSPPLAASAQFLVQFGAYRDQRSGAKSCAAAAKLAPTHLESPPPGEATWYRCRTDAPRGHAEAAALIAAAASAGQSAFLVPLPPTH